MSQHDQNGRVEQGAFRAEDFVSNDGCQQAGHVDQTAIGADNGGCRCLRDSETAVGNGVVHVEQDDGLHAVEAKSLPHFNAKEVSQSPRMAEELLLLLLLRAMLITRASLCLSRRHEFDLNTTCPAVQNHKPALFPAHSR